MTVRPSQMHSSSAPCSLLLFAFSTSLPPSGSCCRGLVNIHYSASCIRIWHHLDLSLRHCNLLLRRKIFAGVCPLSLARHGPLCRLGCAAGCVLGGLLSNGPGLGPGQDAVPRAIFSTCSNRYKSAHTSKQAQGVNARSECKVGDTIRDSSECDCTPVLFRKCPVK